MAPGCSVVSARRTRTFTSTRDPSRLRIDMRRSTVNRPRSALRMREKSSAAIPVRPLAALLLQLLEKRIELTLGADGGGRSVAGEDGRLIRKAQERFLNGAQDLGKVAAPKVGAADAPVEECIAAENAGVLPRQ